MSRATVPAAARLDPPPSRRADEQPHVHSYLRSIKYLASWLKGAGHLDGNRFLAVNPYYKKKGVMPVLRAKAIA